MTRRTLQGLVIAGLVSSSAFATVAPSGPVAAAAPTPTTQYAAATAGTAAPVHARPGPRTPQSTATFPRGARPIHPQPGAAQPGAAAAVRAPLAGPATAAPTSTLLRSFDGVSSRDSKVTNFGAQFEPPDQGLCVGNGFVLEQVNSAYRVYRTDGSTVVGPFNINDIFNVGAAEFTSDPRCYYDAATNSWFATILFVNSAMTVSQVDIAVNTSGDPTRSWTEYRIDTTDNGHGQPSHPGCPCLGDQPTLGIDQNNLYFTTNEFALHGPQFNGAQIYAVSKSDMVASRTAHFVHFANLRIGGTIATSVQPALTTGASKAEYLMSSLDPNGTFDSRIGVWALTNTAAVSAGHSPTLSSRVLSSEAYGVPPKAEQRGSSSHLDSGDDRMQQTQFINDRLWGALTTAVTIPNDPAERAGAAWFAVDPSIADGVLSGSTRLARQGYEVQAGHYLIYPAIQSDAAGHAAMGFTRTGADVYPSAAYATLQPNRSSFGAPVTAAAGTGPYDPTATRWGDYSFAVIDPSGGAFWLATEYIPPKSSQTPDGRRNWGTRVMEVCAC